MNLQNKLKTINDITQFLQMAKLEFKEVNYEGTWINGKVLQQN